MDRQPRNVNRHQYITLNKAQGCLYVEGTYDEDFIAFLKSLPKSDRTYEPGVKRWKVAATHLQAILNKARMSFTKVLYGTGGDYEEITVGGVTWQQEKLDL